MTITRAQIEVELVRRTRKRMLFVEMDVSTNGTNNDLSGPMAYAARAVGLTLADPTTVSNTDLAALTSDDFDELCDRAELRLLENIRGNFDAVDLRFEDREEKFSQFSTMLDKAISAKQAQIDSNYGAAGSELEAGTLSLNFQAKHDDD